MFDIGFWEMAFIGVIALVVVGPERLPGVARSLGLWVGKARRMINEVKSDIKKEMDAEDLKNIKHELADASDGMKELANYTSDSFGIREAGDQIKSSLDDVSETLKTEAEVVNESVQRTSTSAVSGSEAKKPITRKTTKKKTASKASSKKKVVAKAAATSRPIVKKSTVAKKKRQPSKASTRSITKKPATKKKPTIKKNAVSGQSIAHKVAQEMPAKKETRKKSVSKK